MSWVTYVPLMAIGALGVVLLAGRFSRRLDRLFSKLALATFGLYVDIRGPQPERERLLKSAYVGTPYRVFASKALFYSAVAAVAGSVVGVYLVSGILVAIPPARAVLVEALPFHRETVTAWLSIPDLTPRALFVLLIVSSSTVGVTSGAVIYRVQWWVPAFRAQSRRRRIELTMPGMIAFMYALARGGLELPRILTILRRHQTLYGESAAEMALASKAVNSFGVDTVAAIRDVSSRTPSEQFRIFTENLASVLESGQSVADFLSEQYEQYQEEAEAQQELFLDRLGAIAEAYVAVFVVGPLFLLTVLLIFGLISGGTAGVMAVIIYGVMPVINLAFIDYLNRSTQPLGGSQPNGTPEQARSQWPAGRETASASYAWSSSIQAKGGATAIDAPSLRANFERLAAYDRMRSFRRVLWDPITQIRRHPVTILYVAVPLAILWFVGRAMHLQTQGVLTLTAMDDVFVQASLVVVLPFAVARRYHTAHLRAIERGVPDLFNRLASLNQAGVEIVDAFEQVRHGDLGPLTPELDRLWRDIQFGADVETALYRFERRTRGPSIRRAVTLISNGLAASGNIGPVLRIAADEARRLNRLKRQREQEMSIYLIITYLAFLVFLTIVFILVGTFIPAIPSQEALDGAGLSGAAAGITQAQAAQFTVLLFHASLLQAIFSGLVAGQMSRGSIRDGAPHVAILMGMAYVLFMVFT